MKKRLINSLILTAVFLTVTSFKAYAAVENYLLKDNSNVYQYNVEELKNSFMNSKIDIEDGLYKEFKNVLSNGEFYQIYDSEKKYISYNEIKNVFLEKKANEENFNLEEEIKKSKEAEVPAEVENIKIENTKVVRELFILKNDFVLDGSKILKDKYKSIHIKANNVTVSNLDISGDLVINPGSLGKVKIDNVKCNLVNVLSGDKTGIAFNKVESKEVKIDTKLEIEIQYEDKTPPIIGGGAGGNQSGNNEEEIEKQAALKQAKAEIDNLISKTADPKEKQVLKEISISIGKAMVDKNYDFNSNMTSALNGFQSLDDDKKLILALKVYTNIDVENFYRLMDMYNIDKSIIKDVIKGKIN